MTNHPTSGHEGEPASHDLLAGSTGWQPIETAQRNGERKLLCWNAFGNIRAHVELGWFANGVWCNTYGRPFSGEPDRWMPLPDPDSLAAATDLAAENARLREQLSEVESDRDDLDAVIADREDALAAKDAEIAILREFVAMIARMETASEFDDRTDGEGMSGDDAVDTVSNLIALARTKAASNEGVS